MNTTEYNRAAKAAQRAEARIAGLCGNCCKRTPKEGKKTCEHCLAQRTKDRRRKRRIARKAAQ
jgi:hypothetical protein